MPPAWTFALVIIAFGVINYVALVSIFSESLPAPPPVSAPSANFTAAECGESELHRRLARELDQLAAHANRSAIAAAKGNDSAPIKSCAVAIFGQVKNLGKDQAEHLATNVIEPLAESCREISVFLHTYALDSITNPRNNEKNVPINVTKGCMEIFKAFATAGATISGVEVSPTSTALSAFRKMDYYILRGRPWPGNVSIQNFILQLYSLDRVSELWWPNRDSYQAVVYMRPDLDFFTKLNVPFPVQNGTLYAPDFHEWGGINDRFASGDPQTMDHYGHRFRYYEEWNRRTKWPKPNQTLLPLLFHAETYLKTIVNMLGLKYEPLKGFRFGRVRANGLVNKFDQELIPGKESSST